MDTAAKGRAIEDRFIGILERMGYKCEKARAVRKGPPQRTWVETYDFWRAFDVLAIHPARGILAAQVTTDNHTVRSKVSKLDPIAKHLHAFEEVLVARWIAPTVPGERGAFGLYRIQEQFEKRWLMASDAVAFPWEPSPPSPQSPLAGLAGTVSP